MFKKFIQRPVLSLVISIFITLLGLLALTDLPVTQYPEIAPPAVSVITKYTGANAEVCSKAVVTPLERAINGVPGMTYMTSVSGNDGTSVIQVYFAVGTDPDQAAVNVQNRVATVLDELPEEVIKAGVSTEKEVNSMLMYLNIVSADTSLDEKFIYNFADINILPELKRIDGVGFVDILGSREYAMRVWLDPAKLDAYELSAEDIVSALRAQNIEAAPGKVGESSGKNPQSLQYVLRYTGKLTQEQEYENVVVKVGNDGELLRLKDIAHVEFGSLEYDVLSKENGRPSAAIVLKQRPGSNASEVIANVKQRLNELKKTSFPYGMDYTVSYDVSRFLDASIDEVIKTLIEAFILVALVVFIFLQDWRSTLIPVLAVPVSLIGTFAFMKMFGFSINLLTLFALVLAIGIVVDNAIVVVEAVHAKMEEKHCDAKTASMLAMGEIGGAIIAITLVMSAVFIPVAFLSGPVGVFYRQFSITMAISIVISGINALTLTPALCAILLKHVSANNKRRGLLNRFFDGFNRYYNSLSDRYRKLLSLILNRRTVTIALLIIFCTGTWGIGKLIPSGFIPTEDQGTIYVNVTTPSGATLERTEQVMKEIDKVGAGINDIESVSSLAGYSLMTEGTGASFGMSTINLKSWGERKATANEVIKILEEKTRHIKDSELQFLPPPAVPGFGNASGFELRLLDKTGKGDLQETFKVTNDFIAEVKKRPEIKEIFTSFNPTFPQYLIHIDKDIAAKKGITPDAALTNLQALVGSYYATNFIRFGQMYKVMLQADPHYRGKPEDILQLRVKNNNGEMVPYSLFSRIERVYGPEQLTRYNMYISAMLSGEPANGYSSGDAISAIEEVAASFLPRGYTYEWSGMTREEIESGNQVAYIFLLCLVFVYLLLSAQYESFLLPLPVILSLPAGVFGSFALLYITGLENNIYAQVAMVMLIGLLGKNAILIIEYAILKRKHGATPFQAAIEGSVARLRPILMTSFAFIAGLIPLMIASGAGAIGNRTIGTAAAGGMLFGTIFGIVLVPGLYVLFSTRIKDIFNKTAPGSHMRKGAMGIILLAALFMTGCKTQQLSTKEIVDNVPAVYPGSDSTAADIAGWKEMFFEENLKALIDTALKKNQDLRAAYEKLEMVRGNVMISRGARIPELQITSGAGQRRYGDYTMDGVGNYDTRFSPNLNEKQQLPDPLRDYYGLLQTSWEIDLWGKLKNKKRAASASFLAAGYGKDLMITTIVSEVAKSYYELLALDKVRSILEKNILLQQTAVELVKAQHDAGKVTSLAVEMMEAQLLGSQSERVAVLQEIVEAESRINLLCGVYPKEISRDTSDLTLQPPKLKAGVPSALLVNRPDIRQAEYELRSMHADVISAKAAFYPSLNISAALGVQAFRSILLLEMPASIAYNVLGSLSAPLLNRRKIKGELMMANARKKSAYLQYEKAVVNAFTEVYNSLRNIEHTAEMVELKKKEASLLKTSVNTSTELFKAGKANYLDVIVAQQRALDADIEQIRFHLRSKIGRVDLYKAIGGGWR